jgi:hypothetical protein
MKLSVNERGTIELKEVYNPIKLISDEKEELIVCMRDSGFEIMYQGKKYSLNENELREMNNFKNVKSSNDTIEELHTNYGDCSKDETATFQVASN